MICRACAKWVDSGATGGPGDPHLTMFSSGKKVEETRAMPSIALSWVWCLECAHKVMTALVHADLILSNAELEVRSAESHRAAMRAMDTHDGSLTEEQKRIDFDPSNPTVRKAAS